LSPIQHPPPAPPRGPALADRLLLPLLALAWLGTMAQVVRQELLQDQSSEDVRALIDEAGLRKTHASATYRVLAGGSEVGRLTSTVSGGQREEQLVYIVEASLQRPMPLELKGFVLAGWDRRPERFVLETRLDGQPHRIEGGVLREEGQDAVVLEARYRPPTGNSDRSVSWILPEAPRLAPGPLPLPELPGGDLVALREGQVADPMTGAPTTWRIGSADEADFMLGSTPRPARRHELEFGVWTAVLWSEAGGFPLKVELPLGFSIELTEEER
jgi:hypothetical protein